MDLLLKAIATAGFVAGLLLLLRHAGPRLGGLAAALPVTSAPALFWLGLEQGVGFAAQAAAAALLSTALTPLLVTVYGQLSQRHGPLVCLLAGLVAAAVGLLLLLPWQQMVAAGLTLAMGLSALALWLLPRPGRAPARRSRWQRELLQTAGVAALLTLLIGLLARQLGAGPSGLLAAIPVVGLCTLCSTHREQGSAVACRFLAGYVDGIAAKSVFLALLASALGSLPFGLAWAAALLGGLASLFLLQRLRQRPQPLTPLPSSL